MIKSRCGLGFLNETLPGLGVQRQMGRQEFERRSRERRMVRDDVFNVARVDRIPVTTAEDYTAALTGFFKNRARQLRR